MTKSNLTARNLSVQPVYTVFKLLVNNRKKFESIIFIAQPTSNISNLLDMFSFATWTIYFLTFTSIVVMRFRNGAKFHDPDESRMPKRLQNQFCLALK